MARLVVLALLWGLSHSAWADEPSREQIARWLPAAEPIELHEIYPLTLKGGEQGYLVSATFPEEARNFWGGYVLARPQLKQAQVLQDYGGQFNEVVLGGESFALIGSAGSGQGHYQAEYSVVAFDGWQAHELYRVAEGSNSGDCGYEQKLCEGSRVFLHFVDVSGAEPLRLSVTEVSYSSTGETDPAPRARTRSELIPLTLPW